MFMAYFFDAQSAEIIPVKIVRERQCKEICGLIGCQQVDAILLDEAHVILCDQDGLSTGLQGVAEINGVPQPLGGNLIIAGMADGKLTTPKMPLDEVANRIDVVRLVMDPETHLESHRRTRPLDFAIRLVRHKPRPVEATRLSA